MEELKGGCFYIIEVNGYTKVTKKEIRLKEVVYFECEIDNAINGTQKIIEELDKRDVKDKIVLLKVFGNLKKGKHSDINYEDIEQNLRKRQAFSFLKNTSKLEQNKTDEIKIDLQSKEMEKIESVLIKKYEKENPSDFNHLIVQLMDSLNLEKQEAETSTTFEKRLLGEMGKILRVDVES